MFLALQGNRLAWQHVGGLLIRKGKPLEAIGPLTNALNMREADKPPVEELLLALAYADAKQPAVAAKWQAKAVAWLDKYEKSMQVASMLGTASTDKWGSLLELVRKPTDPRYNSFDWETWHECDVFRAEVEQKLAGK